MRGLELLIAAAAVASVQASSDEAIRDVSAVYNPAQQPALPSYAPQMRMKNSVPVRRDWREHNGHSSAQYRRAIRTGHTYITR